MWQWIPTKHALFDTETGHTAQNYGWEIIMQVAGLVGLVIVVLATIVSG